MKIGLELIFLCFLQIGTCGSWSVYNDETLFVDLTSRSRGDAAIVCAGRGGYLVEPIMPDVEDAVHLAAEVYYPVTSFWTGIVRNSVDGSDWLSQDYHITPDHFVWKMNSTPSDPGDCLGVDIRKFGLRYFPAECSEVYPFICQMPKVTRNTSEVSIDVHGTPIFHTVLVSITKENCQLFCLSEDWCIGYEYDWGPNDCRLLNSSSVAMGNITENLIVCTIVNVTECDPLNVTYSYDNCTETNGTNVMACVEIPPTDFTFSYDVPTDSCADLLSPVNGQIRKGFMLECDSKSVMRLDVNLTCGEDMRWNFLPRCPLNTGLCPPGYEQYQGICYHLGSSTKYWHELESTCAEIGGYPLHIHRTAELDFLALWLHYSSITDIWTGGTYRNIEETDPELYYWIHSFELVSFTQWEGDKKPTPSNLDCIALKRNSSTFSYVSTPCYAKKEYICVTGSSNIGGHYCRSDAWCKGKGVCLSGWKNTRCVCYGVNGVRVGLSEDPSTYCTTDVTNGAGSDWWKVQSSKPWPLAIAACKSFGGSIYTPLDTAEEAYAQATFSQPGYGGRYWTALHTLNGTMQQKGVMSYNVSRIESLPLRKDVDLSKSQCLFMIISEIGVRFYAVRCSNTYGFICERKATGHGMLDSDNTGVFTTEIQFVLSSADCELECMYSGDCLAYTFFSDTNTCHLFDQRFTGINLNPNTVEKSKPGSICVPASPPHNGAITSQTTAEFTYSCNLPFVIDEGAYNTIACLENGMWSDLPLCVRGDYRCPSEFEQDGLVCYYTSFGDGLRTWYKASAACNSKGAYLAEIKSDAEMQFLSIVLSYNARSSYWIGATDEIVNSYYTWSSSLYTEITYKDWFWGPSNHDAVFGDNCVSLTRFFNYTDQERVYYEDSTCESYKSYVCMLRLFNIGQIGCNAYGEFSCKIHASCVDDKCVCDEGFLQIGEDAKNSTYCKEILPIGGIGCLANDELCLNDSVCVSDKCSCPTGMSQNGPDLSYSTSCLLGEFPCDEGWTYHKERCFKLLSNKVVGIGLIYEGFYHCGQIHSYPAVILAEDTNQFVMTLGTQRTKRFIGLKDFMGTQDYTWSDGSALEFITFLPLENFNASAGQACTFMNEAGYWQKEQCSNILGAPDVVCEKPRNCLNWTLVDNAVSPTGATHVGAGDYYVCEEGYTLAGSHNGYVECVFNGTSSYWSTLPECRALDEELFSPWPIASLYGLPLSNPASADKLGCMNDCQESSSCVGIWYNAGTCNQYTNMSQTQDASLVFQTSQNDVVFSKVIACDPPQEVAQSYYHGTGRKPGDSVTYKCESNYRETRITPSTLTCQGDGTWDYPPPACKKRFKRQFGERLQGGDGMAKVIEYHAVLTVDECERRCMTELRGRCLSLTSFYGACILYNKPPEQRGIGYENHYRPFSESLAVISILTDSDLDRYKLHFDHNVLSGTVLEFVQQESREICAQKCSGSDACSAFDYVFADNGDAGVSANCTLYTGTITLSQNSITTENPEVYIKTVECSQPPSVPNAVLSDVIRQSTSAYTVGDSVQATCTILGEHILDSHSGEMECLPTGFWSHPPVCKNLCDAGWYMFNSSCYKIYDISLRFWDAYQACHTDDAGLVNVHDTKELDFLHVLWNETGQISAAVWLGIYSDLGQWHWTEKLGENIAELFPSLGHPGSALAIQLVMNTLNLIETSTLGSSLSYICKKSAGRLKCPSGWEGYKDKCYQVRTTPAGFTDAENDCKATGGNLASLHSWWQKDIVTEVVFKALGATQQAYVGLHKDEYQNFKWTDGSVVDFMYQITYEPSMLERCGVVSKDSDTAYSFTVVECNGVTKPYVCQAFLDDVGTPTDFTSLPCSTDSFCKDADFSCTGFKTTDSTYQPACRHKDCPAPYEYIDGGCFLFSGFSTSEYPAAVSYCHDRDGSLLTIDSMKQNYLITEMHILRRPAKSVLPALLGYDRMFSAEYTAVNTRTVPKFRYFEKSDSRTVLLDAFTHQGYWMTHPYKIQPPVIICKKDLGRSSRDFFNEGCFTDVALAWNKDLPEAVINDPLLMTVEMCIQHCQVLGFKYAALQNGNNCGCGKSRGRHGRALSASCNVTCAGNSSQICGGKVENSVYRVSGNPCSESMVRSPLDLLQCYSSVSKARIQEEARTDCALQGGYLTEFRTPETEETVHSQLLLSSVRIGETQPNSKTWLGLLRHDYWFSNTIEPASFFLYRTSTSNIHSTPGSVAYINYYDGKWQSVATTTAAEYSCQFIDTDKNLQGLDVQRHYNGTHSFQSSPHKWILTDSSFDNDCLNDINSCPGGFVLRFWLTILQTAESFIVLQTGNCASNTVGSDGLCVFYEHISGALNVLFQKNDSVLQAGFFPTPNKNTSIVIFLQDIYNIHLFQDGTYYGLLKDYSFTYLPSQLILYTSPFLNYQETDKFLVSDLTFTLGPPDEYTLLLQQIQDSSTKQSVLDFFHTYLSDIDEQANVHVGIDGNGLRLGTSTFSPLSVNLNPSSFKDFELGFWIKIPRRTADQHESINILSIFDPTETNKYFLSVIYHPGNVLDLELHDAYGLNSYHFTSSVPVQTDVWQHLALALHGHSLTVFQNGVTVPVTLQSSSAGLSISVSASMMMGSVRCPVLFRQYGTSCYSTRYVQMLSGGTTSFWNHQEICEGYGGSIAVPDNSHEDSFIKSYLSSWANDIQVGVYDGFPVDPRRDWLTADGGRLQYLLQFESSNVTADFMYYSSGVYLTEGDRISNYSLCEVNLAKEKTRIQKKLYCPPGWIYWNKKCYIKGGNVTTGPDSMAFCSTYRSRLVEINSHEEQQFISGLIVSQSSSRAVYIGALLDTTDNNTGYVWGNKRPVDYSLWEQSHIPSTSLPCVTVDCSNGRMCSWKNVDCSSSFNPLCEKPAELQCAPTWRSFKKKCVTVYSVGSVVSKSLCTTQSARAVTFSSKTDMDEFILLHDIGTEDCLTDAILNPDGTYTWPSLNNSITYFNGETLSGSGACVGLTPAGLILKPCSSFRCLICEYSTENYVYIDNVHILESSRVNQVVSKYTQEDADFAETTYTWRVQDLPIGPVLSIAGNRTQSKSKNVSSTNTASLTSTTEVVILSDLTLGSILRLERYSTGLQYTLAPGDDCLTDTASCPRGMSVEFWIYGVNTSDCTIVNTKTDGTTGMVIWIDSQKEKLFASVNEMNYRWETWTWIALNEWVHISVTWHRHMGITTYTNYWKTHNSRLYAQVDHSVVVSLPSTYLTIGSCENASTSLFLSNLVIRDYMMDEEDYKALKLVEDRLAFTIDFNIPEIWSTTNLHYSRNDSLVSSVWRNSLFHTAARVDNQEGASPALEIPKQMFHCFTRTDACYGPFTLSLWLNPREMESDQVFLHTGTAVGMGLDTTSLKLWYNSYTDKYLLEALYDKTNYTIEFYIYLYEWSHIMLAADFAEEKVTLYVNQEETSTISTTLQASRIIPRIPSSFFRIGEVGRFDIDDIQFSPGMKLLSDFYVQESCLDYSLAGFHGIRNLTIDDSLLDNDTAVSIITCDLTTKWSGYYFSFDNSSIESSENATVTYSSADYSHIDGIYNNATLLNKTAMIITDVTPLCLRNIQHCFFGLTVGLWLRIEEVDSTRNSITILEIGGNATQNGTGVSFICEKTPEPDILQCEYLLVNSSQMWSTTFTLAKNQWTHVAMTWNQFRTMQVYINGHSLLDFGMSAVNTTVSAPSSENDESAIFIGGSNTVNDLLGIMAVDEAYIIDTLLTEEEIREMFGQRHECDFNWQFFSHTDKCYKPCTAANTHGVAETDCQSLGGNLAYIPDLMTYSWLGDMLNEEQVTGSFWIGLKQLPREGFPLRWSSGHQPDFNLGTIDHSGLNPSNRYCGQFRNAGTSWYWDDLLCTTSASSLCEVKPLYVKFPVFHLNSSSIKDNTELTSHGHVNLSRGVTRESLVFTNLSIVKEEADSCLVNFAFCHNGLKIEFWVLLEDLIMDGTRKIILSSQENNASYGFNVYIHNDTTGMKLGVDILTDSNFTSQSVPLTSQAWTHVSLSFTNTSLLTVYLNGKQAAPLSLQFDANITAARELGERVQVVFGSSVLYSHHVYMLLDNLTVNEVYVTDPEKLYADVYTNVPIFRLPFDTSVLLNSETNTEDSWLGSSISMNTSQPGPISFTGQFAYDCLGSPDFCQEGFSFTVWIKPMSLVSDHVVLSSVNKDRGFAVVFFTSHLSKTNNFWIITRSNLNEVKIPFELVSGVWSNVEFTWYINGSTETMVNGHLIADTDAVTTGITPQGQQPVVRLEFSPLVDLNLEPVPTFDGGIDEFTFYRHPLPSDTLLYLYKNSTFVKNPTYWPFDHLPAILLGNETSMTTSTGSIQNASRIESGNEWLNLTAEMNGTNCILDIDSCVHGFTVHLNVKFVADEDWDQILLSTGADNPAGMGITLMFTAMNKSLPFRRYFEAAVLTSTDEYRTWFNIERLTWTHITISWHKIMGIKVLVDGELAAMNVTGAPRSPPIQTGQLLFIGRYPEIGYNRGLFEVDEFHFLERATFGDTLSAGETWHHRRKQSYSSEPDLTATEVTLDECFNLCKNSDTCLDFAFCDNLRYGTCAYGNSSQTVATNASSTCDLFVKMEIGIEVQEAGCIDVLDIPMLIPEGTASSDEGCHSRCKNLTYVYSAPSSAYTCLCGKEDLTDVLIRPNSESNFTCISPQLKVWQVQGRRSFLDVTVPITEFDVDFFPGTSFLFNQTINITMVTTAFSYAGFGIDAGNGSEIFYTGRNETELTYELPGRYLLTIYALNEISTMVYTTELSVLTSIESATIETPALVATFDNFEANVTVTGGMYVTCNVTFDENTVGSKFMENTTDPIVFNHTYYAEGQYQVNLTCYNGVSAALNSSFLTAIDPVINFTVNLDSAVVHGNDINVSFTADKGTNVTTEVYVDGVLYISYFTQGYIGSQLVLIPVSVYQTLGLHTVTIILSNIVTPPQNTSMVVYTEEEIKLRTDPNILPTYNYLINEHVNVSLDFLSGSNVNATVDFASDMNETFYSGNVSGQVFWMSSSFSQPGEYSISISLENAVSSVVQSTTVYVDVALDGLAFSVIEPPPSIPLDPVQFVITLPPGLPAPYGAYIDIDLGDGNIFTQKLNFSGNDTMLIFHNFTSSQNYNLILTAYSNVSSVIWNCYLELVKPVTNLTVIPNAVALHDKEILNLKINISLGYYVQYFIYTSDGNGTIHISSADLSTPNAAYEFNHVFSTLGKYWIEVVANNSISSEMFNLTVIVVKPSAVVLVGDRIGNVGDSLTFNLIIDEMGEVACFLFGYGDGDEHLYGDPKCQQQPDYAGIPFSPLLGSNLISVTHIYTSPGRYDMEVKTKDVLIENSQKIKVRILQAPCDIPDVEIYGFSKNISEPSTVMSPNKLYFKTYANSYCIPMRKVLFQWRIVSIDHVHYNFTDFEPEPLPFLVVPPGYLQYGLYEIGVYISIDGYPEYYNSCVVYVNVVEAPLVLSIVGDDSRTAPSGSPLVLDASLSHDPDYPIHNIPFNFTWYCWLGTGPFTYASDFTSPNLTEIGTADCFEGSTADSNSLVVTVGAQYVSVDSQHTVVAVMQHGNRNVAKTQTIIIQSLTNTQLMMSCFENCVETVSPDAVVRVKGVCTSCNAFNRLQPPYKWKLYHSNNESAVEGWETWTSTGVSRPNVVIRGGFLSPGATYELRFFSGSAFTYKRFYVNLPPYNGTCSSNHKLGMAFATKFRFHCENWLDEGDRQTRDFSTDLTRKESFKYTLYYEIMRKKTILVPFFQLVGNELTTPDIMLPNGLESFDMQVNIVIQIEDQYRGVTTYNLTIKILENFDSPATLLKGHEIRTCEADKDMTCILMMNRGIADMAHGNNSNQITETVIDYLEEYSDFILDPIQLEKSALLLNRIGESDMESISDSKKESFGNVLKSVVSSTETVFKDSLSSEERQGIAKGLLLEIARFAQRTKYDPSCSGDHCSDKIKIGDTAIDLFEITHNITSLLLEETFPGEEPVTVHLEEGNTYLRAECIDVLDISNSTIEFQGKALAELPDLSSFLDPSEMEYVFLEVVVSDNLYTTDMSVQQIKSRNIAVSLVVNDGTTIAVKNLKNPIEINFYIPWLSDPPFIPVDLSSINDNALRVLRVQLNETHITPYILLSPEDKDAEIEYYIGVNEFPTKESFAENGTLTLNDNGVLNTSLIMYKMDIGQQNSTATSLYVGLANSDNFTSPLVNFSVFAFGCSYWSKNQRRWTNNGLSLGEVNLESSQFQCLSTHLTSFGANLFVPPNTIDFTTVFSKFSADNLAVLCTVGACFLLYFILVIWARKMDKRDYRKWRILPLTDNLAGDIYHYHMTVYTGIRRGAGTTSKVYFVLGGEEQSSEIRLIEDVEKRPLSSGSVNNYLVSMPFPLGDLHFLTIWHDMSGKAADADWYLNMVILRDIQTNKRYLFLCDSWLSVDKGDGLVERVLPVASDEEIQAFGHLFFTQTRKDLTDGHLWISVLSRPMYSNFTRVQRLSCCLSLLFLTMITNMMWYNTNETPNQQNIHLGPFTFSTQEFTCSIFGSLIVVPVSLLIITFFRKAKRSSVDSSTVKHKYSVCPKDSQKAVESRLASYMSDNWLGDVQRYTEDPTDGNNSAKVPKKKGKTKMLPHWCIYVAWLLVAISVIASGFFTILYSFEWGSTQSSKWLTAFFLSFIESVLLVQPLKVVFVAIVFAIVFKAVEEDGEVIETFKAITRNSIMYTSPTFPAHRKEYTESPISDSVIYEAREHRKKLNKLFEVVREILIYVIYLTVVAVLAYENQDKHSFRTFNTINNDFVMPASVMHNNFINVSSVESFWHWTHESLVPGLFSDGHYNGNTSTDLNDMLADNTHYRIGPARLRQARIVKGHCEVAKEMLQVMPKCESDYGFTVNDDDDYFPGWKRSGNSTDAAWKYQDTFALDGLPMVGRYASYSGGGYVASLGDSSSYAHNVTSCLKSESWIDAYTRAIFVEFNVYNPNVNLFTVVVLVVEFPATGGAFPWPQISPLVLYRYTGPAAVLVLAFDIVFVIFTIFYVYDIYKRIKTQKREFLLAAWNYVDFLNICLSVSLCALYGVHFVESRLTLRKFRDNKGSFVNLNHLLMWDQVYHHVLSILLFSSMLKLLQLVRFNTKITQLSSTLSRARGPILSFCVVFGFVFVAFCSAGYLIFGRADPQYKSYLHTTETLMSMLLMKVNINNMLQVNGTLGYFFLFLFVLFIVFILINMLLSILNDAFTEVRADPKLRAEDPKIVDFLVEQLKNLIFPNTSNPKGINQKEQIDSISAMERKIAIIDKRMQFMLERASDDAML